MKKSTSGFTVVELLIVIVIIAILAAISIVAYSGIQQRANNTKTLGAVSAYVKALGLYKADEGQHPPVAASCLGDQYGAVDCDSTSVAVDSGGLNTLYLSRYFGSSVPMPSEKSGVFDGSNRVIAGAWYIWNSPLYGGANNGGIGLYHQGGGNCPSVSSLTLISNAAYFDGSGTWCRYSIN